MNLLPKSHKDFSEKEYWNDFFKKRGKKAFDWYGEYPELCGQLHKYIKVKDDILVVGCGNSKLSSDLYDIGYNKITNIDISAVVIKQMNGNNKDRPEMKYINMDATEMTFQDDNFSVVLDKGTLDALMPDDSNDVKEIVLKYLSEINRVLRSGGRYVCVSLLQEHILKELLNYFPENNYCVRIIRCFEAEQKTAETSTNGTSMPVFIIVATKFKQLPQQILEVCFSGDKMQRLKSIDELFNAVSSLQKAALVCNRLQKGSIAGYNEVSLDLFRPECDVPRFTIHILDQLAVRGNGKYAAFIVPQGRETDWLFSSNAGRQKLLLSAHHDRLAIISMHRGEIYTTWESVKDELSESVKNLAPHDFKDQIPFLSLGSEVGKREILFKGHSDFSGEFIVEEISGDDGKIFRRLIFLSNQFVIQSEALVKIIKQKKKQRKVIDHSYLACQHHLYMTIGTRMSINDDSSGSCLVIGLGGGGLCTFINQCLKSVITTAIEIDSAILEIAIKFFGLIVNDKLKVIIDDGIEFLKKAVEQNLFYNAILFDIDSKDLSLGMSCPPQLFIEQEVINNVKCCLKDKGIFILNLVCRDESLRESVLDKLRISFKSICSYKLEEDVNEVIYCTDNVISNIKQWELLMEKSANDINSLIKKLNICSEDIIEVETFVKLLKLEEK